MIFSKFVKILFLKNTTGRLLLIMAVSTVAKGELGNETVNYDTETKHMYSPIPNNIHNNPNNIHILNVTLRMSHANSIDFNIGSQYNVK